jgi:hypothetical protein
MGHLHNRQQGKFDDILGWCGRVALIAVKG